VDPPSAVDCDGELLDRIRVAVVDGLHKIPHGGIEIGGLLLGERQADRIKVTEWRLISCEHALGPSFTLSESDEAALRESIESAASEGFEVVGWFHSHTRSGLQFTEKDQALHERFFPEAWQVALLLRPAMLQPTRAAYFRRRSDGSWDLSPDEFLLDPPEKPPRVDGDSDESKPGSYLVAPQRDQHTPSPEVYGRAIVVPLIPSTRLQKLGRSAIAAACIVALSGLLFAAWRISAGRTLAPIALQLHDEGGRIRISWNSDSAALKDAKEGRLVIRDGTHSVEHRLKPADLKRGSMQYLRSADNVQVRLTVLRNGQQPTEEWTSFIGPSLQHTEPAPAIPKAEPGADAASELDKQKAAEAARLEALKAEEARLRTEMQRLEQARIRAEEERLAQARQQAEREHKLQRVAEEAKSELARLQQQLKAAPPIVAPSGAPELPPAQPPQSTPGAKQAEADLVRTNAPATRREPASPTYSGPDSGRIIWTGDLPKNGILSIQEARASLGALTGRLPRQPIRIRAYPAELSERGITIFTSDPKHARGIHEAPSRENGWNQTTYRWAPGRAADLSVVEGPGARNDWRKIVLRNDSRRLSMIVLDWELIRSARR
jgi:proteasome lid subunit RPN8/RPN11